MVFFNMTVVNTMVNTTVINSTVHTTVNTTVINTTVNTIVVNTTANTLSTRNVNTLSTRLSTHCQHAVSTLSRRLSARCQHDCGQQAAGTVRGAAPPSVRPVKGHGQLRPAVLASLWEEDPIPAVTTCFGRVLSSRRSGTGKRTLFLQ